MLASFSNKESSRAATYLLSWVIMISLPSPRLSCVNSLVNIAGLTSINNTAKVLLEEGFFINRLRPNAEVESVYPLGCVTNQCVFPAFSTVDLNQSSDATLVLLAMEFDPA
ncbi:hypothetical protein D3C73_943840 [compost metagenome]